MDCPARKSFKEILVTKSKPYSQYLMNFNSCSPDFDFVKSTNEGIKFGSYDRVLRRRRTKAFKCIQLNTHV